MKIQNVNELMSKNYICIDKNTTIAEALKKMVEKGVFTIIVKENDLPKGIVTERDFTTKVLLKHVDISKETIDKIMSSPIISILPTESLENAAKLMVSKGIRKLPVVENSKLVGIITEDDIIKIAPDLISLAGQNVTDWTQEIIKWLTSGSDKSEDPVNLIWDVKLNQNMIVAEHPKVPFILNIMIANRIVKLNVHTGLETALLDPIQRLDISRKLLFLNDRTSLVKFVIRGINEEIVLSSELDLASISKEEFGDALTGLITALYLMIKEFKLEEEFNKQLAQRVILMIQERMQKGATREDLLNFLINKVGMDQDSANKLLDEIVKNKQSQDLSYFQ
ncbi:MAG: cyclic nucleotide-binding/CBS domain-containing protein [Thermoplasmata archaeon]|nr:CBS domain-containing protein [Thermoplasmata archaeon]